jgi:hypothetical protein
MNLQKIAKYLNQTPVMLWAIILSSLYLCGIIYWQSENFGVIDPIHVIQPLDPKIQRNSSQVEVGLFISSFPSFSFSKNKFTIDGTLWFKFQSGTESLETLGNFTIQNGLTLGDASNVLFKSEPIIKRMGNEILVSYHIQADIKTSLNYKNFPLAQSRLNIIIINKTVTARELSFISKDENLFINPNNLVHSYKPISHSVKTGYTQATLTKNKAMDLDNPTAVFAIVFDNVGIRDLISLYFPMFVLFLIALFCLVIDIKDTARLGYVGATVPILVLFRMVIDTSSPEVGLLTHVDFIYNLLVFLSLIILLFQTYVILQLQHAKARASDRLERRTAQLTAANNVVFFFILIALIIGTTATFFR